MNFKNILYLLLSVFSISNAYPFTYCDSDNLINIISVDLKPNQPIIGENLEIDIKLNSSIDISEASGEVEIKAFGIKLYTLNFDPCKAGVTCPLSANTIHTLSISETIPKEAPANIKIDTITTITTDNKNLVCVDLSAKLVKPTFFHLRKYKYLFFPRDYLIYYDKQPTGCYNGDIAGNPLNIIINEKTQIANITAEIYGMKYNCPDEKYTYLATNSSIILSNDPNDCLNKVLKMFGLSYPFNIQYNSSKNLLNILDTPIGNIQLSSC